MNMNLGNLFKNKRNLIILIIVIVGLLLGYKFFGGSKNSKELLTTYEVKRGNLSIDVVEAASIEASEAFDIKSELEGDATIIFLIDDGTMITEEDVKNGKVLVELDSANLRQKATQQEMTVQDAKASLTEAESSYQIQVNQNDSNFKNGELTVKFAQMDLEKYIGDKLAPKFISGEYNYLQLFDLPDLGGEALQTKRQKLNDIDFAQEEMITAKNKLDWTIKLEAKGYVTRDEKLSDELSYKQKNVDYENAKIANELFQKYEFPKEAEKRRSDLEEATKELERIVAKNESELAKVTANQESRKSNYQQQVDELERINSQIEKCTIRATRPGLVVYGSGGNRWRQDTISEGSQIRERQVIINFPDVSSMCAKAKIHESIITRVKNGQKAKIVVDALPDKSYNGTVTKVGVVPLSQGWLNPDLKVYMTDVTIDGSFKELKPGMTSQVQIFISELKNVIMVPLQAVSTLGNESVCFVMKGSKPQMRKVVIGDYNDKYIEIKEGLKEGENVVLYVTDLVEIEKAKLNLNSANENKEEESASDKSGFDNKGEQKDTDTKKDNKAENKETSKEGSDKVEAPKVAAPEGGWSPENMPKNAPPVTKEMIEKFKKDNPNFDMSKMPKGDLSPDNAPKGTTAPNSNGWSGEGKNSSGANQGGERRRRNQDANSGGESKQ